MTRQFLEAFYRLLEKQEKERKKFDNFEHHLLEGRLNKKETEKIRKMLFDLFAENKETRRTLEKTIKGKAKAGQANRRLKGKGEGPGTGGRVVKNDLAELRKESARKDDLIRAQEQKLKTISREEEESLRRRVHDLERQERKTRHEIAELGKSRPRLRPRLKPGTVFAADYRMNFSRRAWIKNAWRTKSGVSRNSRPPEHRRRAGGKDGACAP